MLRSDHMAKTEERERKTKSLKIRLTPDTYARLEALAAKEGTTMGGWIADIVNAGRAPRMAPRAVRAALEANRRAASGVRS